MVVVDDVDDVDDDVDVGDDGGLAARRAWEIYELRASSVGSDTVMDLSVPISLSSGRF